MTTERSPGADAQRPWATSTLLQVESRDQVSSDVIALTLIDPHGRRLPPWTPGSHVDLLLPDDVTRQYSLCGDRWDTHRYRVAVLKEPAGRGGSRWIHDNAHAGELLGFGGPRNHFPLFPADHYLFIAGGIGITPILPMIQQAEVMGLPWSLVYGGRSRQSIAFLDELEQYGDKVRVSPQDEAGSLDLPAALSDWRQGTKIYCCGPPGLLAAVAAETRHLPPFVVYTERFTANAEKSSQNRSFTLRLRRSGLDLTVAPDESALDALTRAGVGIVSSCRQGTCGTCEVAVLEGQPDHRDSVLSRADRAAGDCIIPCVSRATSTHLVLDV